MEKRTNWKTIILTALISGAISVITAMIVFYFQQPRNLLVYHVNDTLPFESPTENLGIFHIDVKNKGNHLEENITCEVKFDEGKIEKYRILTETPLNFKDTVINGTYKVNFPNFNSEEKFTISILLASQNSIPEKPVVLLRSKGTNGKQEEANEESPLYSKLLPVLLSAFMGLFSFLTIFKKGTKLFSATGMESNQLDVFVHLCSKEGLNQEAENYLTKGEEVHYWSEADKLTAIALSNLENEKSLKIINVLKGLLKHSMATRSEGVILYDIAKIYKALNREGDSLEYLEKAKKKIGKIVATRLKADSVFNEKNSA